MKDRMIWFSMGVVIASAFWLAILYGVGNDLLKTLMSAR